MRREVYWFILSCLILFENLALVFRLVSPCSVWFWSVWVQDWVQDRLWSPLAFWPVFSATWGLDEIAQRHLSSDSAMPLAHRSSAAQKAMIAKRVVIIDL